MHGMFWHHALADFRNGFKAGYHRLNDRLTTLNQTFQS